MINKRILINYSKLIAKHDSLKLLIKSLESIKVLTKLYWKDPQELMAYAYIITDAIAIKVNNKLVTKVLMDNWINLTNNKITNVSTVIHCVILFSETREINKGQAKQVHQSKLVPKGKFILFNKNKAQVLTTKAVSINISCLLRQLKMRYGKQFASQNHKNKDYKTIPLTNSTSKVLIASTALYAHFATAIWKHKTNFAFSDPFTKQILSFNTDHFKSKPNKVMIQKLIDVNYKLLDSAPKFIHVPSNYIKSIINSIYVFKNAVSEMYPKNKFSNSLEHQAIIKAIKDIGNLN